MTVQRWITAIRPSLLCLGALCVFAAQPWNKDPSQWTAEEVQHILQASPWSQLTQAAFAKGLTDQTVTSNSLPDGSSAGLPGNKGRWDGGIGRAIGTDLPTIPITVRWDSAEPIRVALLKAGEVLPATADRPYVIAILGLWPGEKAAASAETGEQATKRENQDHLREELRSARLLRHGRQAIAPAGVDLNPATGTIRLAFPRQEAITVQDKEVAFSLQFGPLYILKKFKLKDMVYQGKLEL